MVPKDTQLSLPSPRETDYSEDSSQDGFWSDTSSISSATSFGPLDVYGGQDFVLQEYTELILSDAVVKLLLLESMVGGLDTSQLQTRLRNLLKQLGADLRRESSTLEQRRMAKFISLKSNAAAGLTVRRILNDNHTKHTESSSEDDTE